MPSLIYKSLAWPKKDSGFLWGGIIFFWQSNAFVRRDKNPSRITRDRFCEKAAELKSHKSMIQSENPLK